MIATERHPDIITNMIVLFTDFGLEGPYVGQIKYAIASITPNADIIDLIHDAPRYQPKYSSYLLSAYSEAFKPGTIFVSVVDPGVGGPRDPLMISANEKWFVGPDNGIFEHVVRSDKGAQVWRIEETPTKLSASFHGRDIFAPSAAKIFDGFFPDRKALAPTEIKRFDWPDDLNAIIYVDHFGNAITGLRASNLTAQTVISFREHKFRRARVFSDVAAGEAFWYENSNGLIEIAVNRAHTETLGLSVGSVVSLRNS